MVSYLRLSPASVDLTPPRRQSWKFTTTPSWHRIKEVIVQILLDYSAAFDTVDHGILLSVLENQKSFSVTGTALDWIRSFLVGRFQIFQIGPNKSSTVIVFSVCLEVQSSVHCSTSSMQQISIEAIIEKHGVKMHIYADDTQLYDHSGA